MKIAHSAGVVAIAAAFGLTGLAQVATQQTQGRGGAAGGTTTGTQQTQGRGATQGQGQAQTPTRDTSAQTQQVQNTGVISGVVTVEGLGAPVRRARINLTAQELRGGRSTITNDQGQFSFSALPAGRYTVRASKAGYLDMPYGAKRAGRPGTPIQLAAGQKMERAFINMPKGSIITGVVVDDTGEPSPRTTVRAMRYVMQNGERTLQQAGSDQSDDRGMYRIYALQPGNYLVSAVPQNQNVNDLRQAVQAEIEGLLQSIQGMAAGAAATGAGGGQGGGRGGGGGGGRGGGLGAAGIDLQQIMGGRGGGAGGRLQQLQEQLAQTEEVQATTYAPVYYPGTTTPSTASPVTLAVSEERSGVDFRLQLVATAKVEGGVVSPDGALPQGTQVTLLPIDQDSPTVPGTNTNQTRISQDGTFAFRDIAPGRYRVMVRGAIRAVDPNATAQQQQFGGRGGGGRGGPGGGPGQIQQVLWGSADVTVNGEDVKGVSIQLQQGMTITGRVTFDAMTNLPPDMSNVRVNLQPRGQQAGMEFGPNPPATVDAQGRFTIKGVVPGKYSINANVAGGGGRGAAAGGGGGRGGAAAVTTTGTTANWVLKSVLANNRDALDFGIVVEPNQDVNATVVFGEKTQEVTGTIQDPAGAPTADYTIVLFPTDKGYWVPNARRIRTVRPGTDGKFTFGNLPVGDYRLTAVTDIEPGEQYDPAFLEQLANASIAILLREGEKKVQDIKVQGGG